MHARAEMRAAVDHGRRVDRLAHKQPSVLEAEIIAARAILLRRAEDDVVEQLDAQQLTRLLHLARDVHIGIGGTRIARGMIVHEDDGVGLPRQRGPERLARMKETFVERAARHFLHGQHLVLRVEADDADALVIEQPHLVAEQARDVAGVVDGACLGLGAVHTRGDGERGLEPDRLGLADALDARQFADRRAAQRLERAEVGEEKVGQLHHGSILSCRCAAGWRAARRS